MVAKCSSLTVREMWIQILALLPTENMPLCTLSRPQFSQSQLLKEEYWSTSIVVRIKLTIGIVAAVD